VVNSTGILASRKSPEPKKLAAKQKTAPKRTSAAAKNVHKTLAKRSKTKEAQRKAAKPKK
jgi:hypothetical protein